MTILPCSLLQWTEFKVTCQEGAISCVASADPVNSSIYFNEKQLKPQTAVHLLLYMCAIHKKKHGHTEAIISGGYPVSKKNWACNVMQISWIIHKRL